jgi:hypothetical protein
MREGREPERQQGRDSDRHDFRSDLQDRRMDARDLHTDKQDRREDLAGEDQDDEVEEERAP